jgi:hypothetical protein
MVAPLLPRQSVALLPEVPRSVRHVLRELQRIERLRDPRSVYAYCMACSTDF